MVIGYWSLVFGHDIGILVDRKEGREERTKKEGKKGKKAKNTLFIFYKNLVYKNIKAWNRSKIKNIVVILLVAISVSFEGFDQKMTFL